MITTTFAAGQKDYVDRLNALIAELNAALTGSLSAGPATTNGLTLVYSLLANALTINVKTMALADATGSNPLYAIMRSATAGLGSFAMRTITSALSMSVSSGSTLGHANNDSRYTYVYLIDNAGVLEVAVSSKFFGVQGIVSTTAEGGAGGADSATVMYSATARANVAFLCVGRFKAPQAAAGTWVTATAAAEAWPFDHAGGQIAVDGSGNLTLPSVSLTGTLTVAQNQQIDLSGSSGTNFGRLTYSSAGNTALHLENAFDDAAAEIRLRTRTLGSAINALIVSATSATLPGTLTVIGNAAVGGATVSSTAGLVVPASETGKSSMRVPSGAAPSAPVSGDFWYDGTNLKFRDGVTSRTITWT